MQWSERHQSYPLVWYMFLCAPIYWHVGLSISQFINLYACLSVFMLIHLSNSSSVSVHALIRLPIALVCVPVNVSTGLSVSLSVIWCAHFYLSLSLVNLSSGRSLCWYVYESIYLFDLPVCGSVCKSICLFFCLIVLCRMVCLLIFLSAQTSDGQMEQ